MAYFHSFFGWRYLRFLILKYAVRLAILNYPRHVMATSVGDILVSWHLCLAIVLLVNVTTVINSLYSIQFFAAQSDTW